VCFEQPLNAFKYAPVLATDEHYTATVPAFGESANELHSVHPGHVDVEHNQVNGCVRFCDLPKRLFATLAGDYLCIAELGQHLRQQTEHERVVIQQENPIGV
jgi:hypothetical protein